MRQQALVGFARTGSMRFIVPKMEVTPQDCRNSQIDKYMNYPEWFKVSGPSQRLIGGLLCFSPDESTRGPAAAQERHSAYLDDLTLDS